MKQILFEMLMILSILCVGIDMILDFFLGNYFGMFLGIWLVLLINVLAETIEERGDI